MIKSQKTKRMMAVLITLVIIAGIMPVDLRSNVVAEEVSETTTVKPTETQIKETTSDLVTLRSGEGVKLIKGKDDISIQFPSKKTKSTSGSKNDFKPRYSDYISLFLFLKLASSSENDVYKRIADVVQVNMAKITKNKTFVLKNTVVYYQIKSDISIPPLMLNLQINQGENSYKLNTLCDYEYKNIAGY